MDTTITALVPMRHHSERVPGKNYRLLAGKPLFHYILRTLERVPEINLIVVDTDSPIIQASVQKDFPEVRLLERPLHLRDGEIPMNEVLLHDTEQVESDFYLQTHSTNPFLKSSTIRRALQEFSAKFPTYDSMFSVTKIKTRLWDSLGRAINHNPAVLLRTQDLPPVFEENSCLYIFSRQTLVERRNRLGQRPLMFEINEIEAIDIDDELDFQIAEMLAKLDI